jgi:hypothetical protein
MNYNNLKQYVEGHRLKEVFVDVFLIILFLTMLEIRIVHNKKFFTNAKKLVTDENHIV